MIEIALNEDAVVFMEVNFNEQGRIDCCNR